MTAIADPPTSDRRRPRVTPGSVLSTRERQVLDLVSRGCTNGAVATRLGLSEDTVKTYMRKILMRLSARDRAHAVRRGFELGHLTTDDQVSADRSPT